RIAFGLLSHLSAYPDKSDDYSLVRGGVHWFRFGRLSQLPNRRGLGSRRFYWLGNLVVAAFEHWPDLANTAGPHMETAREPRFGDCHFWVWLPGTLDFGTVMRVYTQLIRCLVSHRFLGEFSSACSLSIFQLLANQG